MREEEITFDHLGSLVRGGGHGEVPGKLGTGCGQMPGEQGSGEGRAARGGALKDRRNV